MRKGLITKIILILLALTMSVSPFLYSKSIYADNILSHPYILGVRIKVLDVEYQNYKFEFSFNPIYKVKVGSGLYDFQGYDSNGWLKYKLSTGVNICNAGSGCQLVLELDDKTITTDYNTNYIYEKTIIFNNYYVGTITIDNTPLAVNGTEVTYTTMVNNENITIGSINLQASYDNNWNYPIESFGAVAPILNLYGNKLTGFYNNDKYTYPLFDLNNGDTLAIFTIYPNSDVYFIFGCNTVWDIPLTPIMDFDQTGLTWTEQEFITPNTQLWNRNFMLTKVKIHNNTSSRKEFVKIKVKRDMKYMPIYINDANKTNINNDFALTFGLQNPLLNNIELIAQGNQQTNNSVNAADNINDELSNSDNEYSTLENQFSSNLNTNLDNIDNSLNLNNNSTFISSANYVKDRFNWLTNNLPAINLVITFSLLVGLTTLLIGKVFK